MTSIDRSIRQHAKELTLAFGALIVVATTLAFTIPSPELNIEGSKRKTLPKKEVADEELKSDPSKWTDEQLKGYLSRRLIYPADGTTRDELVELVQNLKDEN